jgi:hypothetical protein
MVRWAHGLLSIIVSTQPYLILCFTYPLTCLLAYMMLFICSARCLRALLDSRVLLNSCRSRVVVSVRYSCVSTWFCGLSFVTDPITASDLHIILLVRISVGVCRDSTIRRL